MAKDWVGGSAAVFKTLGASNHTDAERQREDYYATEPKATEWLCKLERFEGRILEPSCGEGHMSRVLEAAGYEVVSRDLVDRGYGEVADFLAIDNLAWDGNIVTNPPYKYAQQFVEKALSIIPEGKKVAMFLKLTFLEGKARRALFKSTPPHSCLGEFITTEMRYERRLRHVRQQRSGLRLVRLGERV
nr:MAG TPA: adenine-specific methyltransferase [Caudoviricetes sp.]